MTAARAPRGDGAVGRAGSLPCDDSPVAIPPGPGEPAIDLGGTVRSASVEASLARARSVQKAVGITRVANITGLDHVGVPTWMVVRPLARSLSVSQGKGLTHELAQVSGMMESIELHHAEHVAAPGHLRRLRDAVRDRCYVDPLLLPVRPEAEIGADSTTEWIAGTDLFSGRTRWIVRDCVNLDSASERARPRLFVGSSNGLASGNSLAEALLHALCEVIERDQVSFWLARRRFAADAPATRIRIDSITDTDCRGLVDRCSDAGLRVAIWYVAEAFSLPCFMCTVFDPEARTWYPQRASGFGCHPFRRIALARAMTEALQSRLTHIAGARDDVMWSRYRDSIMMDGAAGSAWIRNVDNEPVAVDFGAIAEFATEENLDTLLMRVLDAVAAQGFEEAIFVDLTRDDIGIPVVHVTVPGLEGPLWKPGYSPGPRMRRFLERAA